MNCIKPFFCLSVEFCFSLFLILVFSFSLPYTSSAQPCTTLPSGQIWCSPDGTPWVEPTLQAGSECAFLPDGSLWCPTPTPGATPTHTPVNTITPVANSTIETITGGNCVPDGEVCDSQIGQGACCNPESDCYGYYNPILQRFERRCQEQGVGKCIELNGSCTYEDRCCSNLPCINGKCLRPCIGLSSDGCDQTPCCAGDNSICDFVSTRCYKPCQGGSPNFQAVCSSSEMCCGGTSCWHGKCLSVENGPCNIDGDCYESKCYSGRCKACIPKGLDCTNNPLDPKCCDSKTCVNEVCDGCIGRLNGKSCASDTDCCTDGVFPLICKSQRCLGNSGIGELCLEHADCTDGLRCDPDTDRCNLPTPTPTPACFPPGSEYSCTDDSQCCASADNSSIAQCRGDSPQQCRNFAKAGGKCDPNKDECARGLKCVNGKCENSCETTCTSNNSCSAADEKCCLPDSGLPESICKLTGEGSTPNCCVKYKICGNGCCEGTEFACNTGSTSEPPGCCNDCPQDWSNVPKWCVPNSTNPNITPSPTPTPVDVQAFCEQNCRSGNWCAGRRWFGLYECDCSSVGCSGGLTCDPFTQQCKVSTCNESLCRMAYPEICNTTIACNSGGFVVCGNCSNLTDTCVIGRCQPRPPPPPPSCNKCPVASACDPECCEDCGTLADCCL